MSTTSRDVEEGNRKRKVRAGVAAIRKRKKLIGEVKIVAEAPDDLLKKKARCCYKP